MCSTRCAPAVQVIPGLDLFKVQCYSQKMPKQRGLWDTMLTTRRAPAVQVIPGLDLFKVQCYSQKMPKQRGLWDTMLTTRRAPAVQVIPGLRPGDPYFKVQNHSQLPPEHRGFQGTEQTDRSGRRLWIAGSSPAMTVLQSTILTVENNGATRPLEHGAFNSPCACRAGHPRHFLFLSSPGTLFFYSVIPGLRPGDPGQLYGFFIYLDCRIKSGNDKRKKPEHDSTSKHQHQTKKKMQEQGDGSTF